MDPASTALTEALARAAVSAAVPDELPLFDDVAADYRARGDALVTAARKEVAVGFGLDLAMMTPYILSAAAAVASFLISSVAGEFKPTVGKLLAGLARREDADADADAGSLDPDREPAAAVPVDPRLWTKVHDVAQSHAVQLGLSGAKATLLADAVVGALVSAESG